MDAGVIVAIAVEVTGLLVAIGVMVWRIGRTTARFDTSLTAIQEDVADLKREAVLNHDEHREMREMLGANAERIARIEGKLGD